MGAGDLFPPPGTLGDADRHFNRMATALETLAAGEMERTEAYESHLARREEAQASYWDNRAAAANAHEFTVERALCEPAKRRRRLRVPYAVKNGARLFIATCLASSGGVLGIVALQHAFGVHL